MGPHTTLTPKIFKLDVHLGYMQSAFIYQLSHQNMAAMSSFKGLMIFGVLYYEP